MDYLVIKIETGMVVASRFGISGGSTSFAGGAEFEISEQQPITAIAKRIASGITGSPRILLSLPAALFAQRTIELPLKELRKVREVLPAVMQSEIAMPVDEAVFDVIPSAVDGRYLAIWARKADIREMIETFSAAGCEPLAVSSEPFAWQLLPEIPADVIISDGNSLAVIQNGCVTITRPLGSSEKKEQLSAQLATLELAGVELPKSCLLFGTSFGKSFFAESLPPNTERLKMPDSSVPIFITEDSFQNLAGSLAVAKAYHTKLLPDFRRGELANRKINQSLHKKLIITVALTLTIVTLLFVSKALQYYAISQDLSSLNRSISAVYREILPGRTKVVDELAEIRAELKKLGSSGSSSRFLATLKRLSELKNSNINGLYEAEMEGLTLNIKGDARSSQGVNAFKAAIAPLASRVDLGEIKSRPDGSVIFSMTATFKEAD